MAIVERSENKIEDKRNYCQTWSGGTDTFPTSSERAKVDKNEEHTTAVKWVDGVVGYRICLTSALIGCPQKVLSSNLGRLNFFIELDTVNVLERQCTQHLFHCQCLPLIYSSSISFRILPKRWFATQVSRHVFKDSKEVPTCRAIAARIFLGGHLHSKLLYSESS